MYIIPAFHFILCTLKENEKYLPKKDQKITLFEQRNTERRNVQILFRIPNINDPYCTDAFLVFFSPKKVASNMSILIFL